MAFEDRTMVGVTPRPAEFPGVSKGLLEALRHAYPARPVLPTFSPNQVMFEAGQQSVLAFLQYHFDSQNKTTTA